MEYISGDLLCQHCGYNLRGLPWGSVCPECGLSTPMPRQRAQIDVSQLDREVEEQEAEAARQRRIDDLLSSWEVRGQRFDRLLDLLEAVLKRHQ